MRVKTLDVLTIALMGLSAASIVFVLGQGGGRTQAQDSPAARDRWSTLLSDGHWIGSERAEVKILEFGDFRCGHCAELYSHIAELQRRYPEHVALIYRHFVNPGTPSFDLALGATCADEQRMFTAFYNDVFGHAWKTINRDELEKFASAVGVPDIPRFEACMEDKLYESRIRRDHAAAKRLGYNGTPSIMVNAVPLNAGTPSFQALEKVVLNILRADRGAPSTG